MVNWIEVCIVDSQTSERSGTIMMVPFPMRVNNQRLFQEFAVQTPKLNGLPFSRDRKETYPVPWGGIEPPKRFWVN